jgi:hypothetical protein
MRLTRTSSGAVVSLTFTCVAWLSLVARFAGGPFELVPGFLLPASREPSSVSRRR